jgi:hypothetical protein
MRRYWLMMVLASVVLGCGPAGGLKSGAVDGASAKSMGVAAESPAAKGTVSANSPNAVRRKIVYRATVDLVVENFEPVAAKVEALVKRFDAYLARANVSGTPGSPRMGRWTIRVPADHYDAFLAASRQLGEVRHVGSDSQEVTEEFYDLEARIRNKKQEEARLLKLLDTATGKLDQVLTVEREISRVRGEIEQMQGRMRVLTDLTAMATVELVVTEIKDYVPDEAVTYGTRARRAFETSLKWLVFLADRVSLAVVALSPWLGVLLVVGVPVAIWRRIRRRRIRG